MENKLLVEMDYDKAEKISILLNNLFINDFFELSMALDEDFISFDDLLKIKDLMIYLKCYIDESLNKTY